MKLKEKEVPLPIYTYFIHFQCFWMVKNKQKEFYLHSKPTVQKKINGWINEWVN